MWHNAVKAHVRYLVRHAMGDETFLDDREHRKEWRNAWAEALILASEELEDESN